MKVHIPMKLPSLSNLSHMHWRKLANIAKKQKTIVNHYLHDRLDIPFLPLLVTITRIGPRRLDDDNLQGACKYVRDQIASVVGVDDGSNLYTWHYEQKTGKFGVDIDITPRLC